MSTYIEQFPEEARIVRLAFFSSFAALAVGAALGLVQVLHRTDIVRFIDSAKYYDVLTLHGVLLVITFTIFFLVGIFTWAITTSLDRSLGNIRFTQAWYGLMVVGTVLAALPMIGGLIDSVEMSAGVLFTFYAPMQAHPLFYLGLAIFIVGTWLAGVDWFTTWWSWKQDNPGERIPLPTFMVLTTMIFWYLSSLGVAASVLLFLLPWSVGIIDQVNALLTRTLFWYFGHAVVYFWLMPAYMMWYIMLPKISGGKLFSDPLARVVFVLFLVLSTPTGIHHQYLDPGIAEGFKFMAMVNTMFLLLPSLLTAFTVVASMEHGARQRGGSGYFGWLRALPWRDPVFTGMALAGLMFAAAAFSGMVNAGMNINYLVHNTWWVVGHFHLTVGTAVALTIMAVSYWFLPQVTGKKLWGKSVALAQVVLWFVGMTFMSNAMHRSGLAGMPRRTAEPQYRNFEFEMAAGSLGELNAQVILGGILLFVSTLLFVLVVVMTVLGDKAEPGTLPANEYADTLSGPEDSPKVLDNLKLWTAIAVILVILAYALPLASIISRGGVFGPGVGTYPMVVETLQVIAQTAADTVVGVTH
ncbi:ba3-type terminal oxidase subunit I [Natronomonas pharaonis DSM 2160]|uniref:Ba3-type terminal oxidase subunit I n=1 Tax=Natronomonas pharaonis (strain ATCC 35678 / DSM 2160 / CIP 103997 / JCM 8858 / NBRC 14720 / NCIMB 2260 / Gabara) TaxID=348780 RepID=A0A1U7EWT6_NATPD|nr:b(o/a)3-type cytochrome-c oxidase subunit 1 [Natronomonas pharaonis]CAI49572.1 ba3-type terminal oxidase subunit I [Natronomonas pharaonis DSM 2160]